MTNSNPPQQFTRAAISDRITNVAAAVTTGVGLAFSFGVIDQKTALIGFAIPLIVTAWFTGKSVPSVGQIQNALDNNLRR